MTSNYAIIIDRSKEIVRKSIARYLNNHYISKKTSDNWFETVVIGRLSNSQRNNALSANAKSFNDLELPTLLTFTIKIFHELQTSEKLKETTNLNSLHRTYMTYIKEFRNIQSHLTGEQSIENIGYERLFIYFCAVEQVINLADDTSSNCPSEDNAWVRDQKNALCELMYTNSMDKEHSGVSYNDLIEHINTLEEALQKNSLDEKNKHAEELKKKLQNSSDEYTKLKKAYDEILLNSKETLKYDKYINCKYTKKIPIKIGNIYIRGPFESFQKTIKNFQDEPEECSVIPWNIRYKDELSVETHLYYFNNNSAHEIGQIFSVSYDNSDPYFKVIENRLRIGIRRLDENTNYMHIRMVQGKQSNLDRPTRKMIPISQIDNHIYANLKTALIDAGAFKYGLAGHIANSTGSYKNCPCVSFPKENIYIPILVYAATTICPLLKMND